jgi:outer membrane lipoprotein-sorting protein
VKLFNLSVFVIILLLMISLMSCEKKEEMKVEVEKPSRVMDLTEVTTVMVVKQLDLSTRLFTLDYGDGNEIVVEAAPDLAGIESIRVGDKVSVTYLKSTAVYVTSPDEDRPPVASSRSVEVDSKDGKPRKFTVDIIEKTSTVLAIDAEKRTATLKDHEGKVQNIEVADDVKNLENVKVGDQVVTQVTEAIAVDISKVEE